MTRILSFRIAVLSACFAVLSAFFVFPQSVLAQPPEMQAILRDFDLTEAELMQLGANLGGRMQELQEKFESRFREPPTLQNYREKVGSMIDEVGAAVTDIVRSEVRDFLSVDQFQKLETRVLQAHTSMIRSFENDEVPESIDVFAGTMSSGMFQMALGPPSFLEFTEDQKQRIFQLQRGTILDCVGAGLELEQQFPDRNPGNSPEMLEAAFKKFRPILLRFKREYEKILTDKQKAKIDELMDDLPDWLWKALPENRGKERPWRPGANSWKPGDGAPGDNPYREQRPVRPNSGRVFPGTE